jgi:sec-independent protein translocase protein TatC
MAEEPEGTPPDSEETEGGPVKSFLEHLEDLRWTLIKVVSTLAVSMLVCLLAGNYLVGFLTYPLRSASRLVAPKPADTVAVHWGTNIIAKFARTNITPLLPEHTTNIHAFTVVPKTVNDQIVLTLQPEEPAFTNTVGNLVTLKNYSPVSAFMVAIKLALYGGLVIALPLVLYFIGQFVLPALKVKEKEFVLRSLGVGAILFLLGMAFCYFLLLQVAFTATVEFSNWLGFSADEWRAEDYVSFVCIFMLAMGASFELPIVILALVKVGLLDYHKLNSFRAYWIVLELVICGFITPSGDPFSMVLMALPLHLLYEVSILISWYWDWKARRREAEVPAKPAG